MFKVPLKRILSVWMPIISWMFWAYTKLDVNFNSTSGPVKAYHYIKSNCGEHAGGK